MSLGLNILLALLTLALGVLAIGGETWDKKQQLIFRKVTRKGWVCVGLLTLTFVVAAYKEVTDHRNDEVREMRQAGERKSLLATNRVLYEELRKANAALASSEARLGNLVKGVQRVLAEAKVKVAPDERKLLPFGVLPGDIVEYHLVPDNGPKEIRLPY